MLNKASPIILPKSKPFDFRISNAKFGGTFKLNHLAIEFFI